MLGVIAAQGLDLLRKFFKQRRVDYAGVAVILDEEEGLAVGNGVELLTAHEATLLYGIGRGAEGDKRFRWALGGEAIHH